ncbi:dihydrofolate reductase family protein [Lysobacter korlensis]|uniref:Dihydrofolate reductase family protein n=1 Tax=Lysobacter korlensis TaxID=553636 RepID=A0ABV6RNE7_9GAMM
MRVLRVFPATGPNGPAEVVDLDDDGSRERLLDWYRPGSADWVRLNLISTVSGSAAGPDRTSESITTSADRRILGVIRQLADVVLVGAGTVRVEGYQLPKRSALAIVTASGDLGGHQLPADTRADQLFVVCPSSAVGRARESLGDAAATFVELPADDDGLDAREIVDRLRDRGLRSIVSEGGPKLAAQLIAANLLDEMCLSQAPYLGGADIPAFEPGGNVLRKLRLTQLLIDDESVTYSRWQVVNER